MASTHAPTNNAYHIVNALNAEWAELVDGQRDAVELWASRHSALVGCHDLGQVLSAIRSNPDQVLGALVAENHDGSELAGRVVLQAMLGKIVTMANRDRCSAVGEYVAQLWVRIRTYPLADRPAKIAANLALDTLKAVTGERRVAQRMIPVGAEFARVVSTVVARETLDHNAEIAGLSAVRLIAAASKMGLIDGRTGAVLHSVYADGLSGRDAAERHQISSTTVRFRCSKAVRKLADHASELADAA